MKSASDRRRAARAARPRSRNTAALLLRMPAELKAQLQAAADVSRRSLTNEAVFRLEASMLADGAGHGPMVPAAAGAVK